VNGSPIKKLVCAINSARYIRTLSILQASSVPLLEGMYIAMDGIENLYARQVLEQAADTVRQGPRSMPRWSRRNYSRPPCCT
jgi:general secretion pathway protein F